MHLFIGPFQPASIATALYVDQDPWLVPKLIPHDGLAILASAPKTGKTCFATALARAIVRGERFLGQDMPKGPVLWCSHEEAPNERTALHAGLTDDDHLLVAYAGELPMLDAPQPKPDRFGRYRNAEFFQPYVFDYAKAVGAKLIVIDSLHAAVDRGNLQDNHFARHVVGQLRRWCLAFHTPVLLLHHLTKSATRGHQPERFADSSQILAASSCHFFLARTANEDGSHRVTLIGRGRHPAPASRLILHSTGVLDYQLVAEGSSEAAPIQSLESRIQALLEDGWCLTAEEIARRLQARLPSVRNLLSKLVTEGEVAKAKGSDRARKYGLATHLCAEP